MKRHFVLVFTLLGAFAVQTANSESLEGALAITKSGHQASARSQKKVDRLSDKTQSLVSDYLFNQRQSDITEAYNAQVRRLVASQEAEIEDIESQIISIEETERAMLPMLNIMVAELQDFISSDVPFLPEERGTRLDRLVTLLDRADVSVAEKYRQILEAYLVEVGYGRTIEAYNGSLLNDNENTHVNYLRMGRVALYYQTLNGHEGGLWLPTESTWQPLGSEENLVLTKALQIAQQQRVPELLALPIPLKTESETTLTYAQ